MHVGIDCSCLAKAERTGVARYCGSLVDALPEALGGDDQITLLYRLSRLKRRRYFVRLDDPRARLRMFDARVPGLRGGPLDVVHGPDLRIPQAPGVPAVSTVHDLSALTVAGIAAEGFKEKKRKALADVARRAAVIICISPYTEQVFLEHYPQAAGRTRIVPQGIPDRFQPSTDASVAAMRAELGLGERYLLFVGQISARKNLGPLLDAFARLRGEPGLDDLELVLAGPVQTGGAEIVERARATFGDAVHLPGFVDDAILPPLYTGAAAFAFTSKAEGFGLPVIEAMACGCPVVVADAGALVSTAGGAAEVVDVDDADEISAALLRVLTDAETRAGWVERGFARAAQFAWRATAAATVQAYRDAAEIGVLA